MPDEPPFKIEAGTFVYENVAGMDAAVQYLADLGRTLKGLSGPATQATMQADVVVATTAIRAYEQRLSLEMLRLLREAGADVYGVSEDRLVAQRVPTFCFNLPGVLPQAVTDAATRADLGIRDGHLYAPRLMKRFGLSLDTGAVRVSLVHYNTAAEVQRLGSVLRDLTRKR